MEINNTIGVQLQQKRDKIKYNYLRDTEAPTKVDSLVRQMKVWDVDVVNLAEMCVDWGKKSHVERSNKSLRNMTKQVAGQWLRVKWTLAVFVNLEEQER